jgi:hypothetical protein
MILSAMITIFCTVVLSVIQGVALNTVVLPLSKGRTLHTCLGSVLRGVPVSFQEHPPAGSSNTDHLDLLAVRSLGAGYRQKIPPVSGGL